MLQLSAAPLSFARALGVFAVAIALSACGSTAGDLCNRLDECNLLQNQSVDECTDATEDALDDLSDGARSDCEDSINECLEFESCSNFANCTINC